MAAPPACDSELELARSRCRALHDRLAVSPALPRHPALRSLLRLVAAELRFLTSSHPDPARPLSSNLPHLSALHLLLAHPAVRSPSSLAPLPGVDFACAFRSRPAWALLSARNPSRLAWAPRDGDQGLRARVASVIDAARGAPPATRPEMLLLVFARGVGAEPARGLAEEFGAVEIDLLVEYVGDSVEEEDGWVSVSFNPSEEMRSFRAFGIGVVENGAEVLSPPPLREVVMTERSGAVLEGGFGAFVGKMRMDSTELVNLDTTALVALVSGISNGGVGRLMGAPEAEIRARFKCNYKFVMDQVI